MLQRGTSIQELINKDTNQPHLLRLVGEDLPSQYFIAIEQVPHVEVCDLVRGIFVLLALHYVFDMEYNPRLTDLYLFFEEKILCLPISAKKSPTYLSATSAIECYLVNQE